MKRQAFVILTTLSLLVMLAATSVYAQVSNAQMARIPFEFVIGNKAYPAGEYTVTYIDTHLMLIRSDDRREFSFVITGPVEAKKTRCELVFNRYGDQYFLSTLWMEGDHVGRAVTMSRSERGLIQARSASDRSSSEPQMVSVVIVGNKR